MTEKSCKKIIGVTGGVGAGKSSVLSILEEEFGARILLADLAAHRLMEPGSEGLAKITEALGGGFLKEDGSVDRPRLAELIFRDEAARNTVNRIIHPLTWAFLEQEARHAPEPLVVIEAAVFDTAPAGLFDELWYIYADEECRIGRLMESRGYSREKCESIIARQDTEAQYRARCGRVIDNTGTKEETRRQLKEILEHEICQHCQREQR